MKYEFKLALACGALIWLLSVMMYAMFIGSANIALFDNIITVIFYSIAGVAALGAYTCHGRKSTQGKVMLLIAAGVFSSAFGTILWIFVGASVKNVLLSVPMIFFTLYFVLLLVGMIMMAKIFGVKAREKKRLAMVAVVLVIIAFFVFTTLTNTDTTDLSAAEFASGVLYLMLNVAIIVVSILSIPLQKNSVASGWGLVLGGAFTYGIASILYFHSLSGPISIAPESFSNLGAILTAAGFFVYRTAVHEMTVPPGDKARFRRIDIIGFVVSVALVLCIMDFTAYCLFSESPDFYIFGDLISPIFAALSVMFAFLAFRLHGKSSYQGKFILCFAIGLLFWLLGDATWGVQDIFMHITDIVSVSDIVYYAGYVFFIIGIYYAWKAVNASITSRARLEYSVIMLFIFAMLYYYFIEPIIGGAEMSGIEKLVTIGYVVLDYMIIGGCILTMPFLHRNRIAVSWTIVILGLVISTLGDAFYVLFADIYVAGVMFDMFWHFSYIIIALGFFIYALALNDIMAKGDLAGAQRRRKKDV